MTLPAQSSSHHYFNGRGVPYTMYACQKGHVTISAPGEPPRRCPRKFCPSGQIRRLEDGRAAHYARHLEHKPFGTLPEPLYPEPHA